MADQRRMRRVGNSWVIPVSREVRRHLKVAEARDLYWHLAGPREAVLTPHPQRVGGKPAGVGLAKDLEAARAEIERLRRKLQGRDVRVLGEGVSQGWMQAIRLNEELRPVLARIEASVVSIERRLPFARRGGVSRRAREAARDVEEVAAPVLGQYETRSGAVTPPRRSVPTPTLDGASKEETPA